MKIGITSIAYPNLRNINLKTRNRYVRINFLNSNSYLQIILKWVGKVLNMNMSTYLKTEGYNGFFFEVFFYDLAHFFNTISYSKQPWITTFETTVPFFRKEIEEYLYSDMNISAIQNKKILEKGLQVCASDSCKALIALSKCSLNIELDLISNFPDYEGKIKDKLIQLYPPQDLFVNSFEEKKIKVDKKLKFMIVGGEFYRKAGLEILRCFEKLSSNYDIELIIVSKLFNDISQAITTDDEFEANELIKKYNGKWLTHFPELENNKVIELMKKVHIGLLPTYSETFGYSVLEFQACGCPVITTDVRALSEINNDNVGWIIPVGEKTLSGEIRNINKFIDEKVIEKSLEKILIDIMHDRNSIITKSNLSIQRIRDSHSPIQYKDTISKLYNLQPL